MALLFWGKGLGMGWVVWRVGSGTGRRGWRGGGKVERGGGAERGEREFGRDCRRRQYPAFHRRAMGYFCSMSVFVIVVVLGCACEQ